MQVSNDIFVIIVAGAFHTDICMLDVFVELPRMPATSAAAASFLVFGTFGTKIDATFAARGQTSINIRRHAVTGLVADLSTRRDAPAVQT
jgi:hypothetical protein